MKKISLRELTRCSVMATLYAAVSIALAPISFGAVQMRAAEALTILPVFTHYGIYSVTLGCLITNAYGVAAGANILGAADILLGNAATYLAALATRSLRRYRIKGLPVLATVPPIVVNAVVVGAELTFAELNTVFSPLLWINMLQVAAGQLLSCSVLGLVLFWSLEKTGLSDRLFKL